MILRSALRTVYATKFETLQNSKQNNHRNHRIEAGVYASECAQCTNEERENAASQMHMSIIDLR